MYDYQSSNFNGPSRLAREQFAANYQRVAEAFDREALGRICTMPERAFAKAYQMEKVKVMQKMPDDFYCFRDNGSKILAVAHLDTVGCADERDAHFVDTEAGPVVFSRALDDRLGAYIILDLLPKLGIDFDILLTVGEESGQSTAAFFEPPKEYNWNIEFDRGGTDVVMYQYENDEMCELVRDSGAKVGDGIFSDISYMEHVGSKSFNWGVGYQDYHGPRAHAFLEDTFSMVARFLKFHEANEDTFMPHEKKEDPWYQYRGNLSSLWGGDYENDPYENAKASLDAADVVDGDLVESLEETRCFDIFGDHAHNDSECRQVLDDLLASED